MNHTHRLICDSPSGGMNNATVNTPTGTTEANMNGCRRPHRDLWPSDQEPDTGSENPSATVAMATPTPVSVPDSSSTWL